MSRIDTGAPAGLRPALHPAPPRRQPDHAKELRSDVSGIRRRTLRAIPTWDDGGVQTPDSAQPDTGPLSGGGRRASGRGHPDGDTLRSARGRGDHSGPFFDLDIPAGGYAWWYIDGVSDCGTRAVSVIAFIGSVFSPWYAWSGRHTPANHCCINVATYGPGGRFTMTDRGTSALRTSPDTFTVGPSSLHWNGTDLIIDINEVSSLPLISRVRGQITVTPSAITNVELPLTRDGAHIWRPFAPVSRINVDLEAKGWQFTGHGYFDSNFGTRPLETDFSYWTWGRYPTRAGATCFYDATRRDGTALEAAVAFSDTGKAQTITAPPRTGFKRTLWALRRETRADTGTTPKQIKPMLDAPFYSRSIVQTQISGETVQGVHEALDLNRYANPLLKPMLAVRVPRRKNWIF
jgi:carotenoid 1,2-hydratase